jgi:hypothetical protein
VVIFETISEFIAVIGIRGFEGGGIGFDDVEGAAGGFGGIGFGGLEGSVAGVGTALVFEEVILEVWEANGSLFAIVASGKGGFCSFGASVVIAFSFNLCTSARIGDETVTGRDSFPLAGITTCCALVSASTDPIEAFVFTEVVYLASAFADISGLLFKATGSGIGAAIGSFAVDFEPLGFTTALFVAVGAFAFTVFVTAFVDFARGFLTTSGASGRSINSGITFFGLPLFFTTSEDISLGGLSLRCLLVLRKKGVRFDDAGHALRKILARRQL